MARGFHTTLGSGTTDMITSTVTTLPSTFSTWAWVNRRAEPGAATDRIWDKGNTYLVSSANATFGTGVGTWFFTTNTATTYWWWAGATGSWRGMGLSLDRGDTANNPIVYENGSKLTVGSGLTEVNGPPTYAADSNAWVIGNRADGARPFDGQIAEFALWSVILTDDEFDALHDGFSPLLIRPTALIEYIPLVRETHSRRAGAPTVVGTAVQPHPRVIYPAMPTAQWFSTAAAPGGAFTRILGGIGGPGMRLAGPGGLAA